MRKLLPILLPLLLWAGIACGSASTPPAASGQSTEVIYAQTPSGSNACPSSPAASATAPSTPIVARDSSFLASSVEAAAKIIADRYVGPPPSNQALLEAAWTGARNKLKLTDELPVKFTGDPGEQFRLLADLAAGKATIQEVTDAALSAMAASLKDDHTSYIPSSSWAAERQGVNAAFGFRVARTSRGVLVMDIMPGSPAEEAGLQRGDLLTDVDGRSVLQAGINDYLRGREGDSFSFTYVRRGEAPAILTMALRSLPVIQAHSELLEGDIGYVHLYSFPRFQACGSTAMFEAAIDGAIKDLESKGARGWILDLRGNSGGAINSAAFLAGRFGLQGRLASIYGRAVRETYVETTAASLIKGAPLAIIVDEQSASSSEITSFALQSEQAGTVVGVKSAGKVAAAVAIPVGGGGLQVTVGHIGAGASGLAIDGGVTPDIVARLDLTLLLNEGRDSQIEAAVSHLKAGVR